MTVKVFQIVKDTGFVVSMITFHNIKDMIFGNNCFKLYPEGETDDIIEYPRIGEHFDYAYFIEEV